MNDEYIDNLIHDMLFKTDLSSNPVSSYGSIDLDEFDKTIKRLKKIPDINELMKENNQLQSNWNSLREWLEKQIFTRVGSSTDLAIENHSYCKVLDKMNELEGVDNENNNV